MVIKNMLRVRMTNYKTKKAYSIVKLHSIFNMMKSINSTDHLLLLLRLKLQVRRNQS